MGEIEGRVGKWALTMDDAVGIDNSALSKQAGEGCDPIDWRSSREATVVEMRKRLRPSAIRRGDEL